MLEKKCNLVIASFCQNLYEIRDRRARAIRVVNDSSWKLVTLDERIMANPRHMCCPAGSMVRGLVRRQQIDIRVFGNVCTSPRNVWTTLSADEELDCARSTGLRSQLGVRESVALGCATVISASKLVSWTLIYASTLHLPIHVLPWQLVNALISGSWHVTFAPSRRASTDASESRVITRAIRNQRKPTVDVPRTVIYFSSVNFSGYLNKTDFTVFN